MRALRLVPLAALGLLLFGTAGCAGTFQAGTALRAQGIRSSQAERRADALQLAPEAEWRARPGTLAASARYTPVLTAEAASPILVRHRLAAELGGARPAGLQPYGTLLLEYGGLRAADLPTEAEDLLGPRPEVATLTSYTVRGEAGFRGQTSRRSQLRLGLGVDRSAGTGEGSAALPELTRTYLAVRTQHLRTRRDQLEAGLGVAHFALAGSRLLLEGDARATRKLSPEVSVSVGAGGAAAYRSAESGGPSELAVRPLAGAAVAFTPSSKDGLSAQLSVQTRPEYDRLDGGLRQRLQAGAAIELPLPHRVRASTRVQWARDLDGDAALRQLLSLDGFLRAELARSWSAELGGRLLRQGYLAAAGPDTDETRFQLGISRSLGGR